MQLTLDRPMMVNSDVVFKEIDGEAVLLDVQRGTYFGLDHVGTRIWHALVEHGSARAVVDPLLEEFEVTREALEADIAGLLGELTEHDLIRPRV